MPKIRPAGTAHFGTACGDRAIPCLPVLFTIRPLVRIIVRMTRQHSPRPAYIPTPRQILAATARIQAGWPAWVREARGGHSATWTVPEALEAHLVPCAVDPTDAYTLV